VGSGVGGSMFVSNQNSAGSWGPYFVARGYL
jgi:hypothetical protein